MAFSDWTVLTGTTTTVLNAGLSNPLPPTVGGNFARLFSGSPLSAIRNNRPEFTNIPITKAISTSICLRRFTGFSGGFHGGLRVKGTLDTIGFTGQGYGLIMQSGAAGQIVLRVQNGAELTIDGLPTPSFYSSNWIRLRMEVTPVVGGDRIKVFRETVLGSDVWDALGISGGLPANGITISNASPQYAPWGTGRVYIQNGITDFGFYVDTFTMSVTNL
jgi:hypothetical protein